MKASRRISQPSEQERPSSLLPTEVVPAESYSPTRTCRVAPAGHKKSALPSQKKPPLSRRLVRPELGQFRNLWCTSHASATPLPSR
jgi:hypothetical protein